MARTLQANTRKLNRFVPLFGVGICAQVMALAVLLTVGAQAVSAQANSVLDQYFSQSIGLSRNQLTDIRNGQAVATALPSRTPSEVFLFGAVYIQGTPERYVKLSRDFDRLRQLSSTLALGVFSNPPTLADLNGFGFDSDDIQAIKHCKPGECLLQVPEESIEDLQKSVNWSATDVEEQVNQRVRKAALRTLLEYQSNGNRALGVYVDKPIPTDVSKQFAYILDYSKALPTYLPEFYHYLLAYPQNKPVNVDNAFYWARVKFGLKPTLRVVHVITMRGNAADPIAYVIAEKQLYSSHYFETALDLTFCVLDPADPKDGFYLIKILGSELAGLTGVKGSIVRKAAVGRSISNLQNGLSSLKNTIDSSR